MKMQVIQGEKRGKIETAFDNMLREMAEVRRAFQESAKSAKVAAQNREDLNLLAVLLKGLNFAERFLNRW